MKTLAKCSVDGCENNVAWKGFCTKHYQRERKHGNPLFTKNEMHGLSGTPEMRIWACMKDRCNNSASPLYKHYGGRGISVSPEWTDSFKAFYDDMGPRPSPDHEIDRRDNNGNYCKENCHWVTHTENIRNRRTTKVNVDMAREIRGLAQSGMSGRKIAAVFGISQQTVQCITSGKIWRELASN